MTGVGEQAYVVYTVDADDEIGEAVANARLANVLVTVHYSGGDDRDRAGRPLPVERRHGRRAVRRARRHRQARVPRVTA